MTVTPPAIPAPTTVGPQTPARDVIDLDAPVNDAVSPPRINRMRAGRDSHLLRMSLHVQVEALLRSLTASSVPKDGPLPWRRWFEEDVELARELTAAAVRAGAPLPGTLGVDPEHADTQQMLSELVARYESLTSHLRDLLDDTSVGGPVFGPVWRAEIEDALHRCEERLAELREHQVEYQRPTPDQPHAYLPGELLG